jgi:hypothetical protein
MHVFDTLGKAMLKCSSFAGLVLFLVLGSLGTIAQPAPTAAGHWEGTLKPPTGEIAMTVDLADSGAGHWIGSLSIPTANAVDIPVTSISVEEAAVRFTASGLPGSPAFDAKLSEDGSALSGVANNGNGPIPFQLKRAGEPKVKLPAPNSPLPKEFEGAWEGTITSGGGKARLVLTLSRGSDGKASGVLISVDQGNTQIPVTTVTIHGKELRLEVRAISGTFAGTLGNDGAITGTWTEGTASLPLTLQRAATAKKRP